MVIKKGSVKTADKLKVSVKTAVKSKQVKTAVKPKTPVKTEVKSKVSVKTTVKPKDVKTVAKPKTAIKPKTAVKSKDKAPPKRSPATQFVPKVSPPRKVNRRVIKASEKIKPPTGWSLDCWNLFQDKRSKLGSGEYLSVMAYYHSKPQELEKMILNKKHNVCSSLVDKPKLENICKWLDKHEQF